MHFHKLIYFCFSKKHVYSDEEINYYHCKLNISEFQYETFIKKIKKVLLNFEYSGEIVKLFKIKLLKSKHLIINK